MRTLAFALLTAALVAAPTHAQTPEQQRQMEYERQQREYWRQQEQQRQEQQRQQQLMQDNARRQQEESARASRSGLPGADAGAPGGPGGRAAGPSSQAAMYDKARQDWLKRPPLAASHNPLLGTWTQPASAGQRSADPFAQLGAMMKGGLCGILFSSDGVFEFKPGTLVGIDKRTRRADVLDQVEYRGDPRRVAVIPKASLKLMVFDFEGPDRIRWVGQNCTLVRVGASAQTSRR